ncbi:unnamed protein product [Caenorhabditis auriculariae]|uniref:Uncharacterized protein n=1 Tax=Caenorhabditis auriculariae TaxID=2777116 RepID=A0A8S1HPB3_9PELO|nr:unnamed protein product [Caenorhabditis auriculariae]
MKITVESKPDENVSEKPLPKETLNKENILKDEAMLALVSLSHFIDEPQKLGEQCIFSLSWEVIEAMMPTFLKAKSKEEVLQCVVSELEGMSRKRIQCVIDGTEPGSSSSESETEPEQNVQLENGFSQTQSPTICSKVGESQVSTASANTSAADSGEIDSTKEASVCSETFSDVELE